MFSLLFLRKNTSQKYLKLLYSLNFKIVLWCLNLIYRKFPERIFRENFLMLYCCKDCKKVTRDKKFLQSRFFVCFWCFVSSFLKYKKFFKLGAGNLHFPKYKKLFKSEFFFVLGAGKTISWNIRNFFGISVSRNIRRALFGENIRKFHFPKYQKR